jgi:hypothetical protein
MFPEMRDREVRDVIDTDIQRGYLKSFQMKGRHWNRNSGLEFGKFLWRWEWYVKERKGDEISLVWVSEWWRKVMTVGLWAWKLLLKTSYSIPSNALVIWDDRVRTSRNIENEERKLKVGQPNNEWYT